MMSAPMTVSRRAVLLVIRRPSECLLGTERADGSEGKEIELNMMGSGTYSTPYVSELHATARTSTEGCRVSLPPTESRLFL